MWSALIRKSMNQPFDNVEVAVASFEKYDKKDGTVGGSVFGRHVADATEGVYRVVGLDVVSAIEAAMAKDPESMPVVILSVEELRNRYGGTRVQVNGCRVSPKRGTITVK